MDEIRKLKAIIVKQENRIRALEAKVNAAAGDETDARNSNKNGSGQAAAATSAAAAAAAESSHASESANDHAAPASTAGNAHDED